MAFGITPRHVEEIQLDNVSKEQILIAGLLAAQSLDLKIGKKGTDGFTAYNGISMSSYGEEISLTIQGNKTIIKSQCISGQLLDWGRNKKNVEAFITALKQNLDSVPADQIAMRYEELTNSIDVEEENKPAPKRSHEKFSGILSIFIPMEGYFITPILININIIVFVVMAASGVHVIAPDVESLIQWGANFRPATLTGEWWRLFTSCFLHFGVIHLLMNMYALMYIGMLLEPIIGRARFLSAYILAGLAGSALSLFWHDNVASAGASGAIFGMDGVFLAMLTTNLIEKSARQTFLTTTLIFVGYNLVNGLKGGVDNAAHIGGLVSGILTGYAFYFGLIKPKDAVLKYGSIVVMVVVVGFASLLLYHETPKDIALWHDNMNRFGVLESNALAIYKQDNPSREEMIKFFNETAIPNWTECIHLMQQTERLNVPEDLHTRTEMMVTYCNLRLKSSELSYKAAKENTNAYNSELTHCFSQIDSLIKILNTNQ